MNGRGVAMVMCSVKLGGGSMQVYINMWWIGLLHLISESMGSSLYGWYMYGDRERRGSGLSGAVVESCMHTLTYERASYFITEGWGSHTGGSLWSTCKHTLSWTLHGGWDRSEVCVLTVGKAIRCEPPYPSSFSTVQRDGSVDCLKWISSGLVFASSLHRK